MQRDNAFANKWIKFAFLQLLLIVFLAKTSLLKALNWS